MVGKPNEIKQVIVIRRDLKMRRGKEIAQGSHASMAFITRRLQRAADGSANPIGFNFYENGVLDFLQFTFVEQKWMQGSFAKVTLQVHSEEELLEIYQKALGDGLEAQLITDSGKTEFDGVPTKTCLAIGPDYSEKIDPITGDLKLY